VFRLVNYTHVARAAVSISMFFFYSTSTAEATRRLTARCVCGAESSRVVTRSATGSASTNREAQRLAVRALDRVFTWPLDTPCGACGCYDQRRIAQLRRQIWELGFCATLVLVGVGGLLSLVLLFAVKTGMIINHDSVALEAGFTAMLTLVGAGILVARRVVQRAFDPNRDAAQRRGRLHDELHPCDLLALLSAVRAMAPAEVDRTWGMFRALADSGGWSLDSAFAEALTRGFGATFPPSLVAGIVELRRYGTLPAVEMVLGLNGMR
jgi:hypothetical protein